MVKDMKDITSALYVNELNEISKSYLTNELRKYAIRELTLSSSELSAFIDNALNSKVGDLSDSLNDYKHSLEVVELYNNELPIIIDKLDLTILSDDTIDLLYSTKDFDIYDESDLDEYDISVSYDLINNQYIYKNATYFDTYIIKQDETASDLIDFLKGCNDLSDYFDDLYSMTPSSDTVHKFIELERLGK